MTERNTTLRAHLQNLEAEMKQAQLWAAVPPSEKAMASTMPFMYDTLRIEQWLQWVFVPRLNALLDASAPLPGSCSIHPLAEHEWRSVNNGEVPTKVLALLEQIDAALSADAA